MDARSSELIRGASAILLVIHGFGCTTVPRPGAAAPAASVQGVITRNGRPAHDYTVEIASKFVKTDHGYYSIDGIQPGRARVHIIHLPAPKPCFYPVATILAPSTTLSYEMIPYYAASHGPLYYDWRLHRSWGDALDNPFDTASLNGLREDTHTLSGVILKPIYGAAVVTELVWTVPGYVIGTAVASAPDLWGMDFNVSGLTATLLFGYLPIECVAKTVELPLKTVLWPVDRLVALPARHQLERTRAEILGQHRR